MKIRANTLLVADGVLTGKVADPILGRAAKVSALEDISARLGISVTEAMAVGDGANDLGCWGLQVQAWRYTPNQVWPRSAICG